MEMLTSFNSQFEQQYLVDLIYSHQGNIVALKGYYYLLQAKHLASKFDGYMIFSPSTPFLQLYRATYLLSCC